MLRVIFVLTGLLILTGAVYGQACKQCYHSPLQFQYGGDFNRDYLFQMAYNQDYDRRLAYLGMQKASDPQVKAAAQRAYMLHQDRFQLYEGHVTRSYAWPAISTMANEQCGSMQPMAELSGRGFDQAWVSAMIAADQRDIQLAQVGAMNSTQKHLRKQARELIDDTSTEIRQLQGLPH